MRKKLLLVLLLCIFAHVGMAQNDSTLISFLKDINTAIDNRIKKEHSRQVGKPDIVLFRNKFIQMDSLYKYDLKQVSSITIDLSFPTTLYGLFAPYGIIVLSEEKKKQTNR